MSQTTLPNRWPQSLVVRVRAGYRLQESDEDIRAELDRLAGYLRPLPITDEDGDLTDDARHALLNSEHDWAEEGLYGDVSAHDDYEPYDADPVDDEPDDGRAPATAVADLHVTGGGLVWEVHAAPHIGKVVADARFVGGGNLAALHVLPTEAARLGMALLKAAVELDPALTDR